MGKKVKFSIATLVLMLATVSYAEATVNSTAEMSTGEDSFAHIESLDRNIEEAGKEISALKLNSQLSTLRQKAQQLSLDFSVTKISGVDGELTAVIQFVNHSVAEVREGDVIENRYKVVSVSANRVQLHDIKNNNKTLSAPFI